MQIKVKALQNLAHGRFNLTKGQEFEVTKGEADDLIKSGFAQQAGSASEDGLADNQGAKAESAPDNKMERAHLNKMDQAVMQSIQSQAETEQPDYQQNQEVEAEDDDKPAAGKAAPRKTASKKAD